jgi:hypothetical protein
MLAPSHTRTIAGIHPMPTGTPIQIRLQDEEREALDQYRRQQSNPPSRASAARELIRYGLNQRAGEHGKRRAFGLTHDDG